MKARPELQGFQRDADECVAIPYLNSHNLIQGMARGQQIQGLKGQVVSLWRRNLDTFWQTGSPIYPELRTETMTSPNFRAMPDDAESVAAEVYWSNRVMVPLGLRDPHDTYVMTEVFPDSCARGRRRRAHG